MSRVDTSTGKGGGQLTENPTGETPNAEKPAPSSGQHYERQDDKDGGSGKSQKGATDGD